VRSGDRKPRSSPGTASSTSSHSTGTRKPKGPFNCCDCRYHRSIHSVACKHTAFPSTAPAYGCQSRVCAAASAFPCASAAPARQSYCYRSVAAPHDDQGLDLSAMPDTQHVIAPSRPAPLSCVSFQSNLWHSSDSPLKCVLYCQLVHRQAMC
jgi:hypothetical protein